MFVKTRNQLNHIGKISTLSYYLSEGFALQIRLVGWYSILLGNFLSYYYITTSAHGTKLFQLSFLKIVGIWHFLDCANIVNIIPCIIRFKSFLFEILRILYSCVSYKGEYHLIACSLIRIDQMIHLQGQKTVEKQNTSKVNPEMYVGCKGRHARQKR